MQINDYKFLDIVILFKIEINRYLVLGVLTLPVRIYTSFRLGAGGQVYSVSIK